MTTFHTFFATLLFWTLLSFSFSNMVMGKCHESIVGEEPVIKASKNIYVGKIGKYGYQMGKKIKARKSNPNQPICFLANYDLKTGKINYDPVKIPENTELILVAECQDPNPTGEGNMTTLTFKPAPGSDYDKGLVMNCFSKRKRSFGRGPYYSGAPSIGQVKKVFKGVFDMSKI